MLHLRENNQAGMFLKCAVMLLFAGLAFAARADSVQRTNLHVVVKDSETGQPVYQARLTLQFHEPGSKKKLKRPKMLSYSAKTNSQGRYRFQNIPMGAVRLMVTADQHQSFGKDFEVEQENQVIEVKLKKPQPLL